MKKNAMLKIAAILMVAVLLTTCAISSTFAKYVTKGTASSTGARVAKFGFTLDTKITTDGFQKTWATTDDTYDGENTVSASTEVVAPGTSGKIVFTGSIAASSAAEVAVKIESYPVFELTGFDEYCPIIFKVGEKEYATKDMGGEYDNAAKLVEALNADLDFVDEIAPGVAVGNVFEEKTVEWRWDFDHTGDSDTDDDEMKELDEKDTILGNAASAEIHFTLTQSITQID
jgi:hypothetical protein